MEVYLTIAIIGIIVMAVVGYVVGSRGKRSLELNASKQEDELKTLRAKLDRQEADMSEKSRRITELTMFRRLMLITMRAKRMS